MKQNRNAFLTRLVLVILLGFGQCLYGAAAATLVVGMASDYEPLVFKKSGKLVGIEPDNAREIASQMGMEVRYVELRFEELLPALVAGKIDVVMSGLSVTEQRKQQVAFAEPFMRVGQMAIIRADDMARLGLPRAIYQAGVRVGVEPGTTGAAFVAESMPEVLVQDYSRPEQAFAALRAGEVDVYIHDAPTSWRIANSGQDNDLFCLYRLLTDEKLAWAVRKEDRELLQRLNQARTTLEQTGRLRAIQDYWIPVKVEVK